MLENFKLRPCLHLWLTFRWDSAGSDKDGGRRGGEYSSRGNRILKGTKQEHGHFKNRKKIRGTTRVSKRVAGDKAEGAGK